MVDGGIGSIGEVRDLTFREVDYIIERQIKLHEDSLEQTRLLLAGLIKKKPTDIFKLSRDPKPKKWTQEEAIATIKRFGGTWPSKEG